MREPGQQLSGRAGRILASPLLSGGAVRCQQACGRWRAAPRRAERRARGAFHCDAAHYFLISGIGGPTFSQRVLRVPKR